jgi:hypothetical protein
MTVLAGILHDSFTDENGKEIAYEEKVVAHLEGDNFRIVSIPDHMTFEMPKEEFLSKTTDMKVIFE